MTKIDLSGKSGWQSKSGDKSKALQKGEYKHEMIDLSPDKLTTDWIKPGVMARIVDGELTLVVNNEELNYEKGDVIVFNENNSTNFEIRISALVKLEIMIAKMNINSTL